MAINTATIQHRRGSLDDFNPEKLTPGELAVITDERSVYMGFPGGEAEKIVLEKDFTSESIKEKLGYEPADEERVDQLFRDKADYQYVDEKVSNVKVDLTGYAKEDYVDAEIEELNKKIVQETGKLSQEKVSMPKDSEGVPQTGVAGQVLESAGDGTTRWENITVTTESITNALGYKPADQEDISKLSKDVNTQVTELKGDLDKLNEGGLNLKDEVIADDVSNWLDEHPEATTTVQDESITEKKISKDFFSKIVYPIFDTFPTEDTISLLGENTIFYTRGFYKKGDGGDSCYIIHKNSYGNRIKINDDFYVTPLGGSKDCIYANYYGVLPNRSAEENTEAFNKIKMEFGTTLKFGNGHYYFNEGLDLSSLQVNIIGENAMHLDDINKCCGTWLHFENLDSEEYAVSVRMSTVENLSIVGSTDNYNLTINRDNVIDNQDNIVSETYTNITYGLKLLIGCKVNGISIRNFYTGIKSDGGNTNISNVTIKNAHSGIICGNDNKLLNISVNNIMIGIEARGSLNSINSVRGDSIGLHLIVATSINLTIIDADGDFCVGALVAIGDADANWQSVQGLNIFGLCGRCNAKHTYSKDGTAPTLDEITDDNLFEYPKIAVNKNTNLFGANIQLVDSAVGFILDGRQDYLYPDFLLCCGSGSTVRNVKISLGNTREYFGNDPSIDKEYCSTRVKSLSGNSNSLLASVENYADKIMIRKNSTNYYYSKATTETIE